MIILFTSYVNCSFTIFIGTLYYSVEFHSMENNIYNTHLFKTIFADC